MYNATASTELIALLLQVLEKYELVSKGLLESLHSVLSSYKDKQRIPAENFFRIWDKIESDNRDNHLGLHIGEKTLDFTGHFLFSIMQNAPDIKESIEKFCKYHNIMNDIFNPEFTIHAPEAMLSLKFSSSKASLYRHIIDTLLSMYFIFLSKLSMNSLKLKAVRFSYPQPEDISEHIRIFSAPLLFDQKQNQLVFHEKYLNRPIFFSNPELLKVLEIYAQNLQQKYFTSDWSGKVLQTIIKNFPGDRPDIKTVARSLAISARNLQIKLKEEGVNFNLLLKKVSKELAQEYLLNSELSIFEVACLLGYSDQSAFSRSFKQWTGFSPKQYRLNCSGR